MKDCDKITFYKCFKGDKYYEKNWWKKNGEIADELESCIQDIKEYKKQIEEIKEGEANIHVEFSKNHKNKQQNEIKSAY